jgi:hypothetical protein
LLVPNPIGSPQLIDVRAGLTASRSSINELRRKVFVNLPFSGHEWHKKHIKKHIGNHSSEFRSDVELLTRRDRVFLKHF